MTQDTNSGERTPRIAIMGEFSAGKSTLCNLLMRTRALPERVTATRLAPVWMTKGPGQDMRVTVDGVEEQIDVNALDEIPFQDTLYIRLCLDADILDHCDFIDFPGISDPNMDAEVWERVLVEADAVIWLTHATQAWRQSEQAVWDTVPEDVRSKSILLVTRFDKLVNEIDRKRVMSRLTRETGSLFNRIFPISLTEAIAGQDDYDAWSKSGAADMMDHLAELVANLSVQPSPSASQNTAVAAPATEASAPAADTPAAPPAPAEVRSVGPAKPTAETAPQEARIVPRRVRPAGAGGRDRPATLTA